MKTMFRKGDLVEVTAVSTDNSHNTTCAGIFMGENEDYPGLYGVDFEGYAQYAGFHRLDGRLPRHTGWWININQIVKVIKPVTREKTGFGKFINKIEN